MATTVKLEIYRSWTDSETDQYTFWRSVDPVDEQGYDEEQAFPLRKPDLDAVAYPYWRTRRQRGWYQIINHLPSDPMHIAQGKQALATGGDIPVELLRLIANGIDTSGIDWADKAVRQPARRLVGLYACVGRDWAHTFHTALFHNSRISSREAVNELRTLLRSPAGCGRLRRYINRFDLVYDPAEVPWLHLMPSVYPLLSKTPIVNLYLSGPLTKPCAPDLHHTLPRSLPRFSAHIVDITFEDVHFHCFDDLARLFCDLPQLAFFRGEDLTWDTGPTLPNFLHNATTNRLSFINFIGCPVNWPAAGLSYLMKLRPSTQDCALLCTLAEVIEGEDHTFGSCYCIPPAREKDSQDHLST